MANAGERSANGKRKNSYPASGKKIVINRKRGKMLNSEKRVREENLLVVSTLKILTNRKPRERIYQGNFRERKPCNGKRRKHENRIFINRKKDWKEIQTTIAW